MKEDGRIRFLASNRQLEISYTQEKDTARYTCVASNIAGQTKLDFDLHVLGESQVSLRSDLASVCKTLFDWLLIVRGMGQSHTS